MNKDEMIEEMAKVMCERTIKCKECVFYEYSCMYKQGANELYNAGYREVGAGLKVVNECDYERFTDKKENYMKVLTLQANHIEALHKELEQAKEDAYTEGFNEGQKLKELYYEKIALPNSKRETARAILQTINDESDIDMLSNCYKLKTRTLDKIKYIYGIELEG